MLNVVICLLWRFFHPTKGIVMSQKIWNWLIAIGALISLLGSIFLLSGFSSPNKDENLLALGMAIFAVGTLMMAASFYFKARALPATADPGRTSSPAKRGAVNCNLCHNESAVVHCTMHKVLLCATCLREHYESRGCVYVPAFRKLAVRSARGASASR